MRKTYFFYVLMLILAGVQISRAQGVMIWQNGQSVYHPFSDVDSLTFVDDVMEAVDLGLPSGTLWASCNLGASKPENYGDYFAWGETMPKESYYWGSYKYYYLNWRDSTVMMSKYCNDREYGRLDYKILLETEDDAATMGWGHEWQTPTREQFEELLNRRYTTTEFTTQNGVNGLRIRGNNGNTIFLPAAGNYKNSSLVNAGERLFYWMREVYTNDCHSATCMVYASEQPLLDYALSRYFGLSVRPVRKPDYKYVERIGLNEVHLGLQTGDMEYIFADVQPFDAYNPTLTWETSNEAVATVSFEAAGSGTFDPTGAPTGNVATITAVAGGECDIICRATDGSGVLGICHITVDGGVDADGFVDLGLPSGTLWATCNLGADAPEEYGDYYAWGETEPKGDFEWKNYMWMSQAENNGGWNYVNKYTTDDGHTEGCWYNSNGFFIGDGKTELEPNDDAATADKGSEWQMPSRAQFEELISNRYTISEWTTQNGVYGVKVTSKTNRNSIFLPAVGSPVQNGEALQTGLIGTYWSRSLSFDMSGNASQLMIFDPSLFETNTCALMNEMLRYMNGAVRPVRKMEPVEHEYVDLGLPSGTLWATCNIGANNPEDDGVFFAWGETAPKEDYSWETYKYCEEGTGNSLTKYCNDRSYGYSGYTDDKTELGPEDDAATIMWGKEWRTPSESQFSELLRYTTVSDASGGFWLISNLNANRIFLPTPGLLKGNLNQDNSVGNYMTRTFYNYDTESQQLTLHLGGIYTGLEINDRAYGYSVRPVRMKEHEYVDLGLPSGTLWATCNIGADTPDEHGDYFAWGETSPKSSYNWETYQYCKGTENTLTKYCAYSRDGYQGYTDDKMELDSEDDAATASWGDKWQMPSHDQFEELYNNTTMIWTTFNNVEGRLFTGRNGNYIFLPVTGFRHASGLNLPHDICCYWSCSFYPPGGDSSAFSLFCNSGEVSLTCDARCDGRCVRPVIKQR